MKDYRDKLIHIVGAQESNYPWGFENKLISALQEMGIGFLSTDFRKQRDNLETLLKQKADLVLVNKGEWISPDLIASIPCITALWYAEQLGTIDQYDETALGRRKELGFNIHAFDYAFSHDNSNLELYKKLGAKKVYWLPTAVVDPKVNRKLSLQKKHDVVFVGSVTPHRQFILDSLKNAGIDIVIKNIWDGNELNKLYNESKIILNIHLSNFSNTESRLTEVLGSGSFLLSESISSPSLIEDGVHYSSWGSNDISDLVNKINYYLKNEKERESIALNGYSYACKNHTVQKRIEELLSIIDFDLNRKIWPSFSFGVLHGMNNKPTLRINEFTEAVKANLLQNEYSKSGSENYDHIRISEELIEKNNLSGAKVVLESVLSDTPDNLDALNNLSVVALMENELAEANRLICNILDKDPNNQTAKTNYGYLENLMEVAKGINSASPNKLIQEQRVLFVNHSIPPYEISGTPISTLNHAKGLYNKGINTAVIIPSDEVKTGFKKEIYKEFILYKIHKLDKYDAFLGKYSEAVLNGYKRSIKNILDDFEPSVVQINDYVYLPEEIVPMFKNGKTVVVRNVCNDEEICHRDSPVIENGIIGKLCSGPESAHKCFNCYLKNNLNTNEQEIDKEYAESLKQGLTKRIKIVKDNYNIVDGVIFTSLAFKNHFCSFVNINEEKIKIIPRGFDTSIAKKNITVKKVNGTINFGFFSHVAFNKGAGVILEAIEKIAPKNNFKLVFYGEMQNQEYANWIERLSSKYPGKIIYSGTYSASELNSLTKQIDVNLLPSYFESYNRVLRELLLYGVPSIVTEFLGSSIIENGVNGLKIKIGDSDALAEQMINIINNPSLVSTLSEGALATNVPSLDDELNMMKNFYCYLHEKYVSGPDYGRSYLENELDLSTKENGIYEDSVLANLENCTTEKSNYNENFINEKKLENKFEENELKQRINVLFERYELFLANLALLKYSSLYGDSSYTQTFQEKMEFRKLELRKQLKWNAKKSSLFLMQAESFIEKENLEGAVKNLIIILNVEPEHLEALNDLAVVMIMKNELNQAKELINVILKIYPDNEIALNNYSYLSQLNADKESVEIKDVPVTEENSEPTNEMFLKFASPGDLYSPIPDMKDLVNNSGHLFEIKSKEIEGLSLNEDVQIALLNKLSKYSSDFSFPAMKDDKHRYYWENDFYGAGDAFINYSMMRYFCPKNIIEVGSGYSSALMLDTSELFLNNKVNFTFIEPYADRLKKLLKDKDYKNNKIIEEPVQKVSQAVFGELNENDILLIDSSHVVKFNSDTKYLITEILPKLNKGVIIHFHDIFFPFEYPYKWFLEGRAWNEAYFLKSFLQYNSTFKIIYFNHFMKLFNLDMLKKLTPVSNKNYGGSIWLKKEN